MILCTGAGGFIGGHLVRRLLREGNHVRAVDIKPLDEWFQVHARANNVVADLSDKEACYRAASGCTQIYNLAADMGGMGFLATHRVDTLHSVDITSNMIRASFEEGASRFFQASSACVYPDYKQQVEVVSLKESDAWPADPEPCLSADTEVMTRDGFKLISEVTLDDEVATLRKDGFFEYNRPWEIHKIPYSGEMIHFKARSYDCMVTPGHKVFCTLSQRGGDVSDFVRIEARDFCSIENRSKGRFKRDCRWEGEQGPDNIFIEDAAYTGALEFKRGNRTKKGFTIPLDEYLELLGWYITEGHCGHYGPNYVVSIRQCDLSGIDKIKNLCGRILLSYRFESHEGGRFIFYSKTLWNHFKQLGECSAKKELPEWVLELPPDKLQILWNTMMDGDGGHSVLAKSKKTGTYYTSSPRLRDQFIELCMKLGKACTLIQNPTTNQATGNTCYVVSIGECYYLHKVENKNITVVSNYDGFVYDLTIPNHVFYIRRNGKHLWTGNCYGLEKLYGEQFCEWYHKEKGLETRVGRLHNVYGTSGTHTGGREKAPAAICRKVIEAQLTGSNEIEIWGDGNQTRSFMFIDDALDGITKLMNSDYPEPLNIGTSELVTVNQLVDIVEEIAGTNLTRTYDLTKPQGVRGRNSDNTRIKEVLGWEPSIPLKSGLEITYKWIWNEMVNQHG